MHLTRCQPCCALGFKPCNHVFIWMNRFQSDGLTALRCDIWKWSDTNSAPFSGPGPEWVFQSYLKAWIIFPSYIWPHFGLKWVKFSLNNKEKNKANKKKHVFVMPFFIYPFCQNLWFIFISMSAWSTLMFAYIYMYLGLKALIGLPFMCAGGPGQRRYGDCRRSLLCGLLPSGHLWRFFSTGGQIHWRCCCHLFAWMNVEEMGNSRPRGLVSRYTSPTHDGFAEHTWTRWIEHARMPAGMRPWRAGVARPVICSS